MHTQSRKSISPGGMSSGNSNPMNDSEGDDVVNDSVSESSANIYPLDRPNRRKFLRDERQKSQYQFTSKNPKESWTNDAYQRRRDQPTMKS